MNRLVLHRIPPLLFLILFAASTLCAQQSANISTPPAAASFAEDSPIENFVATLGAAKSEDERKALMGAHRELMTSEVAKRLLARGELWRIQDKYAAAVNLDGTALDISAELKDEAGVARALDYLGRVRYVQNDFKGALAFFERSHALWTKLGGTNAEMAETLSDFGRAYYGLRDFDKAQSYWEKAMTAGRASGNKFAMAAALNGFGIVKLYYGDPNSALEFSRQCRSLSEETGDVEIRGSALHNSGLAYSTLGDYRRAIELYNQAIKLFEDAGANLRAARTLSNLALAYKTMGDQMSAIKALQKSFQIAESLGDKATMGLALNNIGEIYFNQGNQDLALHYYQQSLALREAAGLNAQTIVVLSNIADIYRDQGRYDEALKTYDKSIAISESTKEKRQIISSFQGRGDTYLAQKNYAAAQEDYEKALKIAEQGDFKRHMARQRMRLGALFMARGDYRTALEYADHAAEIARSYGIVDVLRRALTVAGQAHRALHQLVEAKAAFTEAVGLIESLRGQVIGGEREQQGFLSDKLAPYTALIELSLEQGDERAAFEYAERAKARVLLDVLHGGRLEINKALTPDELARERTLNGELTALNEGVTRERERDKPDAARLNDLLARQQKARLDYEALQANLYAAHPELAVQRGEARPATLDDLAALVPDANTALLEYLVAEDHTLLFVITKADTANVKAESVSAKVDDANTEVEHASAKLEEAHHPLQAATKKSTLNLRVFNINIKRAELTGRVARLHRQIATRDILFGEAARELYQTLLAPAASQLQKSTRLILVPDGALWELPFQALLSSQGEYVVEHHAISYAPSLSVLDEIARGRARRAARKANSLDLLALGNPLLGAEVGEAAGTKEATIKPLDGVMKPSSAALADLPEAERQVRFLGALYGARQSRVYTGADAREERVKRETTNYRIIHLATHGTLDDASPMYSHVLLTASPNSQAASRNSSDSLKTAIAAGSSSGGEDGLLEAWEMMQLDLHAEMVVLSACETARGRFASGEGMIGLSWALFVAGSPTTVVSQWKVESASATDLMLAFHQHLPRGSLRSNLGSAARARTKAEALQQAALQLLRSDRYRHPFYWAGFIIIGDGD